MAATPQLKIFTAAGEYVAACKYGEEAAILMAAMGIGATIRTGHAKTDIVWTEGAESQCAHESYDFVAETIGVRRRERQARHLLKIGHTEEVVVKMLENYP